MNRMSPGRSPFEWLIKHLVPRELRLHAAVRSFAVAAIFSAVVPRAAAAADEERNRCGCYRDTSGACFCAKKATCGCPGECEPRGCEEKRDKDLQREIQAETKKAEESGRKQSVPKDDDEDAVGARAKPTPASARQRLTPAQAKQFGKLLDLYLSGHPDAGGKTIEELRVELAPAR
jgi:hypothetical protein